MVQVKRPGELRVNTVTVVGGLAVVVATLATAVALAVAGWQAPEIVALMTALVGLATPLVLVLEKLTHILRVNVDQTETLETVERQTNGELTMRVDEAVSKSLERVLNGPTNVHPTVPTSYRFDPDADGDQHP